MLYSCNSDSPKRPPDWRWRKVTAYADGNRRIPRSRSSDILSRLIRFNSDLRACEGANFLEESLAYSSPDIFQAHKTYCDDTEASYKWELEARLLTDQPYSEIAKRLSISENCIDLYEKAFFNVKDRLRNQGWIIHCVIGRSIHAGLNERDYDLLWKMFGYFCGPLAVDLFVNKLLLKEEKVMDFEQFMSMLEETTSRLGVMTAFKAYAFAPINGFTASNMIQVYQTFLQIKKEAGGTSDAATLMQAVDKLSSSLQWSAGSGTMERPVLSSMDAADKRASELRSNEALMLVNGEILLDTEDTRLPEPEESNRNE